MFGPAANLTRIVVVDGFDAVHGLSATDVVKRRLASDHLKRQHSDTPDIDTIVIGLSLDDLGRDVVQCPTVGVASVFEDGSPAQIAQLADSLTQLRSTLVMTTFYGLMSRCSTELSCICLRPRHTCFNCSAASSSVNFFFFLRREKRLPPSKYSITV